MHVFLDFVLFPNICLHNKNPEIIHACMRGQCSLRYFYAPLKQHYLEKSSLHRVPYHPFSPRKKYKVALETINLCLVCDREPLCLVNTQM